MLLACHQARVANLRRENHIVVARSLVAHYDVIYVEDLNIKGLARGLLAKSVNDAAWGGFLHWLDCKAESAGRQVVKVDPCGTSKTCSRCGREVQINLTIRVFRCPSCGLVLDRDVNAAINIKNRGLGLALRGAATPVRVRQRSAKSKSSSTDRSTPLCR